MSTSVRYDDATLADIQRRFREGRPSESAKRKRHSRCTLITSLRAEIEQLLDAGYSLQGIAEYFAGLDVHIQAATLKNYLGRARRSPSGTPPVSARDTAGDVREGSQTRARKPRRSVSDEGAKKRAPRVELGSPEKALAVKKAAETASDGRDTNGAVSAESSGTVALDGLSASAEIAGPSAQFDTPADGEDVRIAPDALEDVRGVQTADSVAPTEGSEATREGGVVALEERVGGDWVAPTPAATVGATVSSPAQATGRAPTLTATKGAARPGVQALGLGNIGFVPRR